MRTGLSRYWIAIILLCMAGSGNLIIAQDDGDVEPITNNDCIECHEQSQQKTLIADDLSHSIHEGLECQDCHIYTTVFPHPPSPDEDTPGFMPGCEGCRSCHEEESDEYTSHGRETAQKCGDIPTCSACHGSHEILPPDVKLSMVHPTNLPETCGSCHEDLDMVKKHHLLLPHPVELYSKSIHGKSSKGGLYVAATCNDCHSTEGTAHKILSPDHENSTINHFNVPNTCSQCHQGVTRDYWDGIHGQLVARGETDAPICTDCHGEHGIINTDDPNSPVSKSRVAEATCSPCHESTTLNEKYGLPSGRLHTFIDSYHGLKSKAGDTEVANCASCHGVHRILASSDSTSTVHPNNLKETCGDCHPGISEELAKMPIHGVSGEGLSTPVADLIAKIYIFAIVIIIGLMALHWIIDLIRQIRLTIKRKPQVKRMNMNEVWQHHLLAITFITLVITGFSLRYSDYWFTEFLFGWEGGAELRGVIHRFAAVLNMLGIVWHILYLLTARGRQFVIDMFPRWSDFTEFAQRIQYNMGRTDKTPQFGRFSYVEKAEYWALVWGSVVMVLTGLLLWFDNWFIQFVPKGTLDVALVFHFYEAWLAFLAIVIWHMYSTVFNPHVYPMNPSWITGRMPEEMYAHEHPGHLRQIKEEEEQSLKQQMKDMATIHSPEEIARGVDDDETAD